MVISLCVHLDQKLKLNKSIKEKIKKNKELITKEDWSKEEEYSKEIENEENTSFEDEVTVELPQKESLFKRILSGLGIGGLYIGGGLLFGLGSIAKFIFTAVVGLGMVWWAIVEFSSGSIIWGLVILLIGTPIAVGIANWTFLFLFLLAILTAIIWGLVRLFGGDLSFWSIWDIIWLVVKLLILGAMAFWGISALIKAIKTKAIGSFFKEYWFYILFFFFLLWLFF